MKLLKNKEYEELLAFKSMYERLKPAYNSAYDELRDFRWEFEEFKKITSLNFAVRRIVVGGKGSGKTTFVKDKILPQLRHNYFLIDMCNEYDCVLPVNKYIFDRNNLEKSRECVIDAIEANRDKVIVFEDPFSAWYSDRWLRNLATEGMNFILITSSTKRVENLFNLVDFIYDLRGSDWSDSCYNENKDKTIAIFK